MKPEGMESLNERAARQLVADALGAQVTRYEDGKAPSQVDAQILFPDGRIGALEIVGDHEDAFNAQWKALEQIGHRLIVPGLKGTWNAQLARRAKVRHVARVLPQLALEWQDWFVERDAGSWRRRGEVLPEPIERLNVRMMSRIDTEGGGVIHLHAEGWSGWASVGNLAAYVERILREQADVPAKLSAHHADERHAFIWSTIGTDYGVQHALEDRGQDPPTEAPNLPAGVTHVWVAGSFSSQGALAWFPDRGWWRVPVEWPIVLDDK